MPASWPYHDAFVRVGGQRIHDAGSYAPKRWRSAHLSCAACSGQLGYKLMKICIGRHSFFPPHRRCASEAAYMQGRAGARQATCALRCSLARGESSIGSHSHLGLRGTSVVAFSMCATYESMRNDGRKSGLEMKMALKNTCAFGRCRFDESVLEWPSQRVG
jgi:hypothetical protein